MKDTISIPVHTVGQDRDARPVDPIAESAPNECTHHVEKCDGCKRRDEAAAAQRDLSPREIVPITQRMIPSTGVSGIAVTRDTILLHARQLPTAPQILGKLCKLLQDVSTNLDQLAVEIRVEPTLAARVIQLSNNAVFGGGTRVGSVDEAVNRVGFGEVLRLVGAATVAGLVDRSLGCYGIAAERLRESLLFHALASEVLASYAEIDGRTAYSAGLLRGIGMMVLDRVGRLRMSGDEAYDAQKSGVYGEWETARFGLSSVDVTALVLAEWRFPEEMVTAVRDHLLLDESGYQNRHACVLNLAGAIVSEHCLALPGDAVCWEVTAEKLAAAGIEEEQFKTASKRVAVLFEQHRKALY